MIFWLIVAVLAVSRITRLVVDDRVTVSGRRWVVTKWGPDSLPSYLVHCSWCVSFWASVVVMPIALIFPNVVVHAILLVFAASYLTGLLSRIKE